MSECSERSKWRAIAKQNGISAMHFNSRIKSMSCEEAATKPIRRSKKSTEYALYHGDELVMIGTVAAIAMATGLAEYTVRLYGTPSYLKRPNAQNRLVKLGKVGDDEWKKSFQVARLK